MPLSKATLEYRKQNQLCPRCGQPNEEGKSMCRKHLDQFAAKKNKYRLERLNNGLCPQCGNNLDNNTQLCSICYDKNTETRIKSYKNRKKKREENNRCSECGDELVDNKYKRCLKCRNKQSKKQAKYRKIRLESKLCQVCGNNKAISKSYCKDCQQKRAEWYQKSPMREKDKQRRKKIKKQVLIHYGGKCKHCGLNDFDVLHLDHINNDGNIERKNLKGFVGNRFYKWVIDNNFPDNLQLLCANCHTRKHNV